MIRTGLRFVPVLLLANLMLSGVLVGLRVSSYPQLLGLPGATPLLLELSGLLFAYVLLILWAIRKFTSIPSRLVNRSTALGLLTAAIQVTQIGIERFLSVPKAWGGTLILTFMFVTFTVWGIVGFTATRSGQSTAISAGMSVWSAVVTMTFAIAFGVALELFLAPIPPESMLEWAEFKRTGWTDVHAFAISNTLDAAVSHLSMGPIIAAIFGTIGSVLARTSRPLTTAPDQSISPIAGTEK
jgi:hypothetical protein